MLNKILKKLSTSGRLSIPKQLAEQVDIYPNTEVAICAYEEYGSNAIMLKPMSENDNCKVIAIVKMDSKRRICMPKFLFPEGREEFYFEIFLFNGDLIIEEFEI